MLSVATIHFLSNGIWILVMICSGFFGMILADLVTSYYEYVKESENQDQKNRIYQLVREKKVPASILNLLD